MSSLIAGLAVVRRQENICLIKSQMRIGETLKKLFLKKNLNKNVC